MWSFSLLLAHIVLIAIAYAWQDGVNLFAEAWDLLVTYPGVLAAAIGVGFLILVMATSARRARRRLRYERGAYRACDAVISVHPPISRRPPTGAARRRARRRARSSSKAKGLTR